MNPLIFRANDIRGHAERDLSDAVIEAIGRAFATTLIRRGEGRMVLARDNRVSSPRIFAALARGIMAVGIDVVDIGLAPTPVFYFARYELGIPSGIMITGSHNPADENGLKVIRSGIPMVGEELLELRTIAERREFEEGDGHLTTGVVIPAYLNAVTKITALARPLRVVVDSGNGMGGLVGPELYRRAGAEVIELFSEPDAAYPNHFPDPTIPANMRLLQAKVQETGADVGIAFDGDCDRLGVVAPDGSLVWGDMLLAIFFREVAEANQGRPVVVEVKCSQATFEDIAAHGGAPLFWKTGHALIEAKMHETRAAMAGEMSGHLYFGDEYHPYDDGIYAGARLLRLLSKSTKRLDALVAELPRYEATPELRVACDDARKFDVIDAVTTALVSRYPESLTIDGIRVAFPHGWALVRCSQTSPRIIIRSEGRTPAERDGYLRVVRDELAKHEGVDLTALDQCLAGEEVTKH